MGKTTALVVIDMQRQFPAAQSRPLQARIKNAVAHARANGWSIINVRYLMDWEDERLVASLRPLLEQDDVQQVHKCDDDGSDDIAAMFKQLPHDPDIDGDGVPDRFILAGVNASCCVAETASGLADIYPEAEVIISEAVADCSARVDYHTRVGCNKWAAQYTYNDYGTNKVKAQRIFQ